MNGPRQAALLLHELGAADREWLVGQLPEAERSALNVLLDELYGLGIPRDGNLLERARAALPAPPRPAAPQGPREPGDALRSATPSQAYALLGAEPVWLLAAVLGGEAWPWREAFLFDLDPMRATALRAAMRKPVSATLHAALVAKLEQQLADMPALSEPGQAASPRDETLAGRLARLKRSVAQWLR